MTLKEVLDRVPWEDMTAQSTGQIRHRVTGACPICAAVGEGKRRNNEAFDLALSVLKLRAWSAESIILAADNEGAARLRVEMFGRMLRAQQVKP